MPFFRIIGEGSISVVYIEVDNQAYFSGYEQEVLNKNECPLLMKNRKPSFNEVAYIAEGSQTLQSMLAFGLNQFQLEQLMNDIKEIENYVEKARLAKQKIIFDPQLIFYNPDNSHFQFIYQLPMGKLYFSDPFILQMDCISRAMVSSKEKENYISRIVGNHQKSDHSSNQERAKSYKVPEFKMQDVVPPFANKNRRFNNNTDFSDDADEAPTFFEDDDQRFSEYFENDNDEAPTGFESFDRPFFSHIEEFVSESYSNTATDPYRFQNISSEDEAPTRFEDDEAPTGFEDNEDEAPTGFEDDEIGTRYAADGDIPTGFEDLELSLNDRNSVNVIPGKTLYIRRLRTGEVKLVNKFPFIIGRNINKSNFLLHDNRSISGIHSQIENRNGKLFLVDLNSKNGTYVNGTLLKNGVGVPLKENASFYLSDEEFILFYD